MSAIKRISCHKIINSRGEWTIETHVELENGVVGVQAIPDGASKGENEALYLDVLRAIDIVEHPINDLLVGKDVSAQADIDALMLNMDGTSNKSHLGGNSILSVSLACAKAAALDSGLPLFQYLNTLTDFPRLDLQKLKYPTPLFNILNGGKHADNKLSFQEFMVIPSPKYRIDQAIEIGVEIYNSLKASLKSQDLETSVGDEGGFAPEGFTVARALQYIKESLPAKYKAGEDVFFGMDVAAGSFYVHDEYVIAEEDLVLNHTELIKYYLKLLHDYEIIYVEDPFFERDFTGWAEFYKTLAQKIMISADDLVVTNTKFLEAAINDKLANAVIVKPNQVGTLTETLAFIKMARDASMSICVSHRSGDVAEDTFIADLGVAVQADFIKSGAPARGERTAKYNRLLEIYNEFGSVQKSV